MSAAPSGSTGKSVRDMDNTEIVEHILRTKKNFYTLFQLPKTCTAQEVQAVYKKMALKCHPDKNKHPMSVEAFKILSSARDVLTNPEIRKNYGRPSEQAFRPQEPFMRHRRGGGGGGAGRAYERGVDSFEDLFHQLFSGGAFFTGDNYGSARGRNNTGGAYYQYYTTGGGAGIRRPRPGDRRGEGQQRPEAERSFQRNVGSLLMFLPFFLFILIVFLMQSNWDLVTPSSYGHRSKRPSAKGDDTLFSFTPTPEKGLVVRRVTSLFNTNVEYFISQKHVPLLRNREALARFEVEVLRGKKSSLERRCSADRHNNRAKGTNEMPFSCEEFRRISQALG